MKLKFKKITPFKSLKEKCINQINIDRIRTKLNPRKYIEDTTIWINKEVKNKKIVNYFDPKIYLQNLQNSIERGFVDKENDTGIKQSTFWAKSISWTIIGGTLFGIGWLCIGKTEEIIVATGKLEPVKQIVDIQMPISGITQKIFVKEGEKVSKGQKLIDLDTEISSAKQKSQLNVLKINEEILKRLQALEIEGAVSKLQVLAQEEKVSRLRSEMIESNVIIKYQEIISPTDGFVFDLKPKGDSFVAQQSEVLMKIVPLDQLKANIEIDSGRIGFVSVGKKVDISVDSFPATDFGVIKGEIESIGSDALVPDPLLRKGYRYPSKIRLYSQTLKLRNGKQLPLQSGMSITANIKLRKVSYLQLLMGTFKDKAKSLTQI
tara:strand:- start:4662 stop:5792 length:1131 start_codon:yes stop_codon:yes gene_type:complete